MTFPKLLMICILGVFGGFMIAISLLGGGSSEYYEISSDYSSPPRETPTQYQYVRETPKHPEPVYVEPDNTEILSRLDNIDRKLDDVEIVVRTNQVELGKRHFK
jgi:hypothetical protein